MSSTRKKKTNKKKFLTFVHFKKRCELWGKKEKMQSLQRHLGWENDRNTKRLSSLSTSSQTPSIVLPLLCMGSVNAEGSLTHQLMRYFNVVSPNFNTIIIIESVIVCNNNNTVLFFDTAFLPITTRSGHKKEKTKKRNRGKIYPQRERMWEWRNEMKIEEKEKKKVR